MFDHEDESEEEVIDDSPIDPGPDFPDPGIFLLLNGSRAGPEIGCLPRWR